MAPRKIVFVTGNYMKLREVTEILSAGQDVTSRIDLQSQSLDLPEVQGTTVEVAEEKVKRAAELVGGPVITEDTALGFKAMNGLPGPYIKWFLKSLGNEGLYTMIKGFPTQDATAICTFAYSAGPGHEPIVFEGHTEGTIVPPRGEEMFGWNPIFEVKGTGKTFAEMSNDEKNAISHRYKALDKLRTFLLELPAE